jgi:hypothetical protein
VTWFTFRDLIAAVPLGPANEGIECGEINYPDLPRRPMSIFIALWGMILGGTIQGTTNC